jgi:hypothetical protein
LRGSREPSMNAGLETRSLAADCGSSSPESRSPPPQPPASKSKAGNQSAGLTRVRRSALAVHTSLGVPASRDVDLRPPSTSTWQPRSR